MLHARAWFTLCISLWSAWCHGRSLETWGTIEVRSTYWHYLVKWHTINMFVYGCSVFSTACDCAVMFSNNFPRYFVICGSLRLPMALAFVVIWLFIPGGHNSVRGDQLRQALLLKMVWGDTYLYLREIPGHAGHSMQP